MHAHEILVSLQNVCVSYTVGTSMFRCSKFTPINDVSFDLHRGETIGIIGRNGAGKSTLLRLIAGIIEPDSGRIINNGARISLLSLGVGFVSHLSGRENAMLSGMLLGLRRNEIGLRLDAIRDFSGLGDFFAQPLHTYSSGMRARLGFSVAIQVDSDVLLIDEVLGVGDEEFKIKSNAEIKRLIQSEKSVVIVSHNLQVLKELCDRLVWIEDGVVLACGEVSDVITHYTSEKRVKE